MSIFRFRMNKIYLWSQVVGREYLPGKEKFIRSLREEFSDEWNWVRERARRVVHDEDKGIFIVNKIDEIPGPRDVKLFFKAALNTPDFSQIIKETKDALEKVEKEWQKDQNNALIEFRDIVRLPFDLSIVDVFITHPALPNGRNYPSKNAIGWTYRSDWKHYNTVYLLHEFLHLQTWKKFKKGDVMHAIVELATDNELRIRLQGKGNYFEEGHSGLKKIERKLYPSWKVYLAEKKENILQFNRRMEQEIYGTQTRSPRKKHIKP